MTTEQLLQPRYEVIADYPINRHFPLGEIFTLDYKEERSHVSNLGEPYCIVEPKEGLPLAWYLNEFEKYLHIFRKLEWWEKRKVEDMPDYVKLSNEEIAKVNFWVEPDNRGYWFANYDNNSGAYCHCIKPSTETEYLEFKNKE